MLDFLKNNIGSLLMTLIILVIVGLIIYNMIKERKKGMPACKFCKKDCPFKNKMTGDGK